MTDIPELRRPFRAPALPDTDIRVRGLTRWLERHGVASWDPYDGLTAPIFRSVRRSRFRARTCLQAVKRSPWNLRPWLGIRPQVFTKSLSDLASAHLLLYRLDADPRHRER